MARKWGISYSVLQNTEINFTLAPWVQTSISGPINSLFDVWLCILHSSWGWFSLDPHFHEYWTFNCSENVCLRLPWFPVGKISTFKKYNLRKGRISRQETKKPNLSDMIIGVFVCFCFSELLNWLLYISADNTPAVWQRTHPCPFYVTLAKACHQ